MIELLTTLFFYLSINNNYKNTNLLYNSTKTQNTHKDAIAI